MGYVKHFAPIVVGTFALLICGCSSTDTGDVGRAIYRNPQVYNVEYCFEMFPDPNKIDRSKDLKLWIPIPCEWDSQKAVRIISVEPKPHSRYIDPEYGNSMLFWEFGNEPEKPSYKVKIKYRLEQYEVYADVDPNRIGSYNKTGKDYILYTQSTHTISITDKVKELAKQAVGGEGNAYSQAEKIFRFVRKKVRYKLQRKERGVGTKALLNNPVYDEKTGEEYYEGECFQQAILFVAMCRSRGIPARTVSGFVGYRPWAEENELELFSPRELELSPDGLAGTRHYSAGTPHAWAEFYVPGYSWIPADPTWGMFGRFHNKKIITEKGSDIRLGPNAPLKHSEGYGFQWVAINNGRANMLLSGIWNIGKIRVAKVTLLHRSDPFPADGLASYGSNTFPKEDVEKNLKHWRQEVLGLHSLSRSLIPDNFKLDQFYSDYPRAKEAREAFVCHMLRRQLGGERFFKLVDMYVDLRQKLNQPVSTNRFQELAESIYGEPLDWFFNQWVNSRELPRLKLEEVTAKKDKEGWQVYGRLLQSGDSTFRLPIEVAIDTKNGREMQKFWIESEATDFDFLTQNEPQKLIVDPDYEVLKIQKMPSHLSWFWNSYPNYLVVYGTLGEVETNKTVAKRLNEEYLGLSHDIIKADTDVNDTDLNARWIFLIGRPETNKIAQRFKDSLPIKIEDCQFKWKQVIYDRPSQGVVQVIENSKEGKGSVVMYAGLSPEATIKLCDLGLYDSDCSYVIFDGDEQLVLGNWEDVDSDLYWKSSSLTSAASLSNQR